MHRFAALLGVSFIFGASLTRAAESIVTNPSAAPADKPLASLPYTPGLDLKAMDRSAQACEDFYEYSCGGWIKSNPIPGDQAGWSVYGKLNNDNEHFLWGILDGLAADSNTRTPTQQLIGDYFAACMDEAAVEAAGAAPIQKHVQAISAMSSKSDLAAVLAGLQMTLDDGGLFFRFSSNQDFADSSKVIAFAAAGGLGLPDRDYYTKEDEHSVTLRHQYTAHVARMFQLLGDAPDVAKQEADTVMRIETGLAQASLTRVESREPHNLFHKMNAKQLKELTPAFDWDVYLTRIGMGSLDVFNVTEPKFYTAFNVALNTNPLADIKTYLRWQVAHETAPYLSSAFVNENFDFFSKTLRGVPELKPRWKRCVRLVDGQLGEALGREFVRRTFGPKLKANTLAMTRQIERALQEDLETLSWMSSETKKHALEKLKALTNKIGYPDKWRDYSAVHVSRMDFLGNVESAELFESQRQLAKIGKPVDRAEWQMTPPTINAYYDPQMNDINFPAGVLQPPLYDAKMDDAPNYGDTGGTIGHELTHGFDDEGRQFDAHGNLSEHAAVRQGVLLQGGPAHGEGEALQDLVKGRPGLRWPA